MRASFAILAAAPALAAACGVIVGSSPVVVETDGGLDAGSDGDLADASADDALADASADASADADTSTFCTRRTGDLACEDFDRGLMLSLFPDGSDSGVVADPTTTSPPNAFEATTFQTNDVAITGFYLGAFDDLRTYTLAFDYRIVAPTPAPVGADIGYVDFHVGGMRTYALMLSLDTPSSVRLRWVTVPTGVAGDSIAADVTGGAPWYHVTFQLSAAGAKSSLGTAAPPAALTGELYFLLGLTHNPDGGILTARYDSATVQ